MADTLDETSFLTEAEALFGHRGVILAQADLRSHDEDGQQLYNHAPVAVLRPAGAGEVAASVQLCVRHGVAIVPQGGNTGIVGGGVPSSAGQVVISLTRLSRIHAVDMTMTVEAGVTLKTS